MSETFAAYLRRLAKGPEGAAPAEVANAVVLLPYLTESAELGEPEEDEEPEDEPDGPDAVDEEW